MANKGLSCTQPRRKARAPGVNERSISSYICSRIITAQHSNLNGTENAILLENLPSRNNSIVAENKTFLPGASVTSPVSSHGCPVFSPLTLSHFMQGLKPLGEQRAICVLQATKWDSLQKTD